MMTSFDHENIGLGSPNLHLQEFLYRSTYPPNCAFLAFTEAEMRGWEAEGGGQFLPPSRAHNSQILSRERVNPHRAGGGGNITPLPFSEITQKQLKLSKWNLPFLTLHQFDITSEIYIKIWPNVFEKITNLRRHYMSFLGRNSYFNKFMLRAYERRLSRFSMALHSGDNQGVVIFTPNAARSAGYPSGSRVKHLHIEQSCHHMYVY